jgi:DNA-directed RNA polymerase subunit L
MGTIRRDGVWFTVYSNDHPPRHVHAATGDIAVIAEISPNGMVEVAERADAICPRNAKRSDVRKVLKIADRYCDELIELWEKRNAEA